MKSMCDTQDFLRKAGLAFSTFETCIFYPHSMVGMLSGKTACGQKGHLLLKVAFPAAVHFYKNKHVTIASVMEF